MCDRHHAYHCSIACDSNCGIVSRFDGSRCRQPRITSITTSGTTSPVDVVGGYAISCLGFRIAVTLGISFVMLANGGRPYTIWYKMQPSDQMSLARPNYTRHPTPDPQIRPFCHKDEFVSVVSPLVRSIVWCA